MNPWTVALAAWAWSAALFSAVALARLWRGRRLAKRTATLPLPAVLLLRPVDAPTRSERESLAAPVDYPGALEQVVLSPFPLDLPGHLRWLPSDPPTRNRKVGHLLYALSVLETQGRVVLAVDADVRVDGALVAALAEPLSQGAALSTAAPEPMVGRGWGARAWRGLLCHTHHSFVALHAMSAATVSGKALGLGAAAQALLPQLTEYVGEDLELGRRVAAGGGEVALARASARVPADEAQTWRSSVERLTRWMQVLRAHRPGLYPTVPLLFTPSLPLIALALLWGGAGLSGAVAALVGVRMALSLSLSGGRGYEWVWGEALLVTAFTRSLAARTLRWRGRSFALSSGGRMVPVFADAPPEGR